MRQLFNAKIDGIPFTLLKAGMSGHTGRAYHGKGRRVINPKTGEYKYVYVEAKGLGGTDEEKTLVSKELGKEIREKGYSKVVEFSKSSEWHQRMLPGGEEYKKMQDGDTKAGVGYVQRTFWSKTTGDTEGTGPSSIAKSLPRTNFHGFDVQDMNQILAIKMIDIMERGMLKNVPLPKFPGYIATVYKNIGINLWKKHKLEQEQSEDISEQTYKIVSHSDSVEEQLAKKEMVIQVNNVAKSVLSQLSPLGKKVWAGYLEGKSSKDIARDVGNKMSDGKVDNFINRSINPKINDYFHQRGFLREVQNPAQYLKDVFRKYVSNDTLSTMSGVMKAKVILDVFGRLLLKAGDGGGYSGKGRRVGSPGNYKYIYDEPGGKGKGFVSEEDAKKHSPKKEDEFGKKPSGEKPGEKPKDEPGKEPEGKPEDEKTKKKSYRLKLEDIKNTVKKSLVHSLKGIAKIITESLGGQDAVGAAAQETEAQGQIFGEQKKREEVEQGEGKGEAKPSGSKKGAPTAEQAKATWDKGGKISGSKGRIGDVEKTDAGTHIVQYMPDKNTDNWEDFEFYTPEEADRFKKHVADGKSFKDFKTSDEEKKAKEKSIKEDEKKSKKEKK